MKKCINGSLNNSSKFNYQKWNNLFKELYLPEVVWWNWSIVLCQSSVWMLVLWLYTKAQFGQQAIQYGFEKLCKSHLAWVPFPKCWLKNVSLLGQIHCFPPSQLLLLLFQWQYIPSLQETGSINTLYEPSNLLTAFRKKLIKFKLKRYKSYH